MFEIICNPIAGKGASLKALETVEKFFNENQMEYKIHRTERPMHASEIAAEISLRGGNLLAMGGDGTFNEVLNGIKDFENVTVGFLPCGTGNDYVRSLDIPKDLTEFLKLIKNGSTGYTDFIEINGTHRSLNCCGTGLDVDVLEAYQKLRWPAGKVRYYLALIKVLFHLKFHKLRLTVDGQVYERSVLEIAAANGKYIGGGMPFSPESILDDGCIDIVLMNECKKSKILGYLIKFLKGTHIYVKGFGECFRVKSAKIEVLDDANVQMDGEIRSWKQLDCKCVHNVLKIFR